MYFPCDILGLLHSHGFQPFPFISFHPFAFQLPCHSMSFLVPKRVTSSLLFLGGMERAHSEGAGLAAHASTGCSIPRSHQANRCSKDPGSLLLQPCPATESAKRAGLDAHCKHQKLSVEFCHPGGQMSCHKMCIQLGTA